MVMSALTFTLSASVAIQPSMEKLGDGAVRILVVRALGGWEGMVGTMVRRMKKEGRLGLAAMAHQSSWLNRATTRAISTKTTHLETSMGCREATDRAKSPI